MQKDTITTRATAASQSAGRFETIVRVRIWLKVYSELQEVGAALTSRTSWLASAHFTLTSGRRERIEAMHMMRKGQAKRLN